MKLLMSIFIVGLCNFSYAGFKIQEINGEKIKTLNTIMLYSGKNSTIMKMKVLRNGKLITIHTDSYKKKLSELSSVLQESRGIKLEEKKSVKLQLKGRVLKTRNIEFKE
jgi:hypothetical protein